MEETPPLAHRAAVAEAGDAARARSAELPGLWDRALDRIGLLLRDGAGDGFVAALDAAAEPLLQLIDRDPDLAIFQVVQQLEGAVRRYASRHAVHAGIACVIAAARLGWSRGDVRRCLRAALTMNLSMLELQDDLVHQDAPPSPAQREQIRSHPARSARLLERAGIADRDWLHAVLQHHERGDGSGYPSGRRDAGEMAQLLQRADVYTAMFSARARRRALAADDAADAMRARGREHAMTAALVDAFGVHPPGATVRLRSGEVGVVARRGREGDAPLVVVLVHGDGEPLRRPRRRRAAAPAHAIDAVLSPSALPLQWPLERLYAVAGG